MYTCLFFNLSLSVLYVFAARLVYVHALNAVLSGWHLLWCHALAPSGAVSELDLT